MCYYSRCRPFFCLFFGNGYYTRTDRGKGRRLCFRLWHSGAGRELPRRRYERPRRGLHRDAAWRVSRIPSGESSKSGVDAFARGELPGRSRTCRRQSATKSLGGTIGGRKNRATRRQIARVRLARREHRRKIVKLQRLRLFILLPENAIIHVNVCNIVGSIGGDGHGIQGAYRGFRREIRN